MTKSPNRKPAPSSDSKRLAAKKPRAKPARPKMWFEATVKNDQLRMEVGAPTKWFRVLVRVLIVVLIALLILKMPEVWQAIQSAIGALPK